MGQGCGVEQRERAAQPVHMAHLFFQSIRLINNWMLYGDKARKTTSKPI